MAIPVGTRVRLKSLNHTLTDPHSADGPLTGTVAAPDDADYCWVQLDRYVIYQSAGRGEWLMHIREDADNLEVLPEEAAG